LNEVMKLLTPAENKFEEAIKHLPLATKLKQ
jgi:hypothetical protein